MKGKKATKTCPQCGATDRDDASFCFSCGVPFVSPTVKPVPSVKVVRPSSPTPATIRVPPPGMCYYHSSLPAQHVCSRCGRPICRFDTHFYGALVLCPQCHAGIRSPATPMSTR